MSYDFGIILDDFLRFHEMIREQSHVDAKIEDEDNDDESVLRIPKFEPRSNFIFNDFSGIFNGGCSNCCSDCFY